MTIRIYANQLNFMSTYLLSIVVLTNQEKALVGAFSVIVKTDGSVAALYLRL